MPSAWLLAACLASAFPGFSAQPTTHRHYIGAIGSYPIQMDLTLGESTSGVYFYERKGDLISLQGKLDSRGSIQLTETSPEKDGEVVTGTFKLKLREKAEHVELEGLWTAAKGGKTLPVKLTESLRYVTTGIGPKREGLSASQEEPVFLDGFKTLHSKDIGHTVKSAKGLKVDRKVGEMKEYVCLWHRPNLSLSLRALETENFNPGPDMGKADYFYSFSNYRMVDGKAVSLQLKDFFLQGPDWQRLLRTKTEQPEGSDVSDLSFSFSEEGLRFHNEEAKFGDNPKLVRWKELEDFLKPGWPQVLGVGPKLNYEVPQPGSKTRQAICDAIRAYEANDDDTRHTVKLLIQSLRVKDIWCAVTCQIFYIENDKERQKEGDGATYVLKKVGGQWQVKVEYIDGDPGSYDLYKRKLPGIPDVILEEWTMKIPAADADKLRGE